MEYFVDDSKFLSHDDINTLPKSKYKSKSSNQILVDQLPEFIEDPVNSYVVKNRPAILNCSVIHSDKVRIHKHVPCSEKDLSELLSLTVHIAKLNLFSKFITAYDSWN